MSTLSGRPDPTLAQFAESVGSHGPIAVEGGRTRWELGGRPSPRTRVVRAPVGVVDHQPAEMIVRVRAGTTVSDLSIALAERRQRCALPDRGGTVGGAVVVGENHMCSLGRGALRTKVLQVQYVSAEGRLVMGGGPTVKNVSGYDLPRLFVGSLGTLGAVAELILRVDPIPATSTWLLSSDADPFVVREAIWKPGAVLWDGRRTWVLLEGHGHDVDNQARQLCQHGSFTPVDDPPALPPHRWSLPPGALRALKGPAEFVASIGVGTVWSNQHAPERLADSATDALSERVKRNFDPSGRLNPGRRPGVVR